MSASLLNYEELIAEVHKLCNAKKSGTVFITTDGGHLVRFVLYNGKIVRLVYDSNFCCYDAIPLVHNINEGKFKFAEGIFENPSEVPLPETDELFKILLQREVSTTSQKFKHDKTQHKNDVIKVISNNLADHIGPFADIICDDYLDTITSFSNIDEWFAMIDTVSIEIDDKQHKNDFIVNTKEQIKKFVK
jgi:hypothetical protein